MYAHRALAVRAFLSVIRQGVGDVGADVSFLRRKSVVKPFSTLPSTFFPSPCSCTNSGRLYRCGNHFRGECVCGRQGFVCEAWDSGPYESVQKPPLAPKHPGKALGLACS